LRSESSLRPSKLSSPACRLPAGRQGRQVGKGSR
jgi:hypothetical protein